MTLRKSLVLTAAVAFASVCLAQVTRLDPAVRAKIEHPSSSAMVSSMRDIPAPVIQACAAVSSEKNFDLAEPNEPFMATDSIDPGEEKLRARRLIWAARLPGFWLVHYEKGGIAHTFRVLLVSFDSLKDTAKVVWFATGPKLKDYDEFGAALRGNKLDDRGEAR